MEIIILFTIQEKEQCLEITLIISSSTQISVSKDEMFLEQEEYEIKAKESIKILVSPI